MIEDIEMGDEIFKVDSYENKVLTLHKIKSKTPERLILDNGVTLMSFNNKFVVVGKNSTYYQYKASTKEYEEQYKKSYE